MWVIILTTRFAGGSFEVETLIHGECSNAVCLFVTQSIQQMHYKIVISLCTQDN